MNAKPIKIILFLILQLFFFTSLHAGEAMPWEGPMEKILASVQGPVVKVVATIAIILAGLGLAFGEGGDGAKKIMMIVIGISIAALAGSIVTSLFSVSDGLAI